MYSAGKCSERNLCVNTEFSCSRGRRIDKRTGSDKGLFICGVTEMLRADRQIQRSTQVGGAWTLVFVLCVLYFTTLSVGGDFTTSGDWKAHKQRVWNDVERRNAVPI